MKVTVLSYYYLPDYSGAAKQWAGLMERMTEEYNIKFTVISARTNRLYSRNENIHGISIRRVDVTGPDALFSFWFNASLEMWKNRSNIDLVIATGLKLQHGFPLCFAHFIGKPTVGRLSIVNSDLSFSTQGKLLGRIHKWCLNRVDKYVPISTALAKEIRDVGLAGNKSVLLCNGVNTDIFRPSTDKEKESSRKILDLNESTIVLFVGVMDERKGVDVLIPAFRRVVDIQRNVKLVMVGPANRELWGGDYLKELKRMVHELGISEKVVFCDCADEIIQYYKAADLLVLPSRMEGMPNVVLEAMACSLPIVGTRISGIEDLVAHDESGILVDVEDEAALADAIIKLVNNPKKRQEMGKKALETVKKRYDMSLVSKSYYNLYQEISQST